MTNYEIENSIKILQEDIVKINERLAQLAEIDNRMANNMNRIFDLVEKKNIMDKIDYLKK
jgi:hypothetical protein